MVFAAMPLASISSKIRSASSGIDGETHAYALSSDVYLRNVAAEQRGGRERTDCAGGGSAPASQPASQKRAKDYSADNRHND